MSPPLCPPHADARILHTSLVGRARALDQLAGFVLRIPTLPGRRRRYRNWVARCLREEAQRARRDLLAAETGSWVGR